MLCYGIHANTRKETCDRVSAQAYNCDTAQLDAHGKSD